MLFTFWARTVLPTATLNMHHLCVAAVYEQKPPARGLGRLAVPRMERKYLREAEGSPQNTNKNTKMQIILKLYRKQTGSSPFKKYS